MVVEAYGVEEGVPLEAVAGDSALIHAYFSVQASRKKISVTMLIL